MYNKLIISALNFFDSFNKKKIISFIDKTFSSKINIFFDIGAHHGETIKLFNKFFKIDKIFGFEASPINYDKLSEFLKKYKKKNVKIFNNAISFNEEYIKIQHFPESSSSSTVVSLNRESNYFNRKKRILSPFTEYNPVAVFEVKCLKLEDFIENLQINEIDLIKIDTEGYDYNVIRSLGLKIKNVKAIYFEHHFHNMLSKAYNLTDIHNFLVKNNFRKAFKLKMFFRKTFEYIYLNKKFYE